MPCSPRMIRCTRSCLHRASVEEYRRAYAAWVAAGEQITGRDHHADADSDEWVRYRQQWPPPLFKDWLRGGGAYGDPPDVAQSA